jgi:hypothetical protein
VWCLQELCESHREGGILPPSDTDFTGDTVNLFFSAAQLIAGARANNQLVVRETANCDVMYMQKCGVFKNFMKAHREGGILPPSDTDFNGDTVNLFFSTLVANMTSINPGQQRNVYGIEFNAKLEGLPSIALRPVVIASLAAQKAGFLNQRDTGGRNTLHLDPHSSRGMVILSEMENCAFVGTILCHADWMQVYPCWTVCEQTMLRSASIQVLKLCDVHYNWSHGPYKNYNVLHDRLPLWKLS